jgi:hypothetical protein
MFSCNLRKILNTIYLILILSLHTQVVSWTTSYNPTIIKSYSKGNVSIRLKVALDKNLAYFYNLCSNNAMEWTESSLINAFWWQNFQLFYMLCDLNIILERHSYFPQTTLEGPWKQSTATCLTCSFCHTVAGTKT